MEYVVFTDESHITSSRFQCLSAFSIHKSKLKDALISITSALKSSNVSEFKWQKLKDARYFFCAEKFINIIFNNIRNFEIRIDALIWDTHDTRHDIRGRDDIQNYERMFFHLLKSSMKRRPKSATWDIRPDERGGIDWITIRDCLVSSGQKQFFIHDLFGPFLSDPHYSIVSFEEKDSRTEPLIQIADLFSGLAILSKKSFTKYLKWKHQNTPTLFDDVDETFFSNREIFRFKLLELFDRKCKSNSLGVSLNQNQCLYTFDPRNPINFWHYIPQHNNDKAPTRA